MIVGLGSDVVGIDRIGAVHRRRGRSFLDRVYTAAELAYCLRHRDPAPSLAARWAAKEAGMKALGTGWAEGVDFCDLEVAREAGGAPSLRLHGVAADRAADLGSERSHLTLSHGAGVAFATVVLERLG